MRVCLEKLNFSTAILASLVIARRESDGCSAAPRYFVSNPAAQVVKFLHCKKTIS